MTELRVDRITQRSETRVRLYFNDSLANSAFQASWFTIQSVDYASGSISVVAAYAVLGEPFACELVVNRTLVQDADYQFTIAVGLTGGSTAVTVQVSVPLRSARRDLARPQQAEKLRVVDVYGTDIRWDGADLAEDASGDLDVVYGLKNLELAWKRRLVSEGLQWESGYGLKGRKWVDSPALNISLVQAAIRGQAALDDRIVAVEVGTTDTGTITAQATPFGAEVTLTGVVSNG